MAAETLVILIWLSTVWVSARLLIADLILPYDRWVWMVDRLITNFKGSRAFNTAVVSSPVSWSTALDPLSVFDDWASGNDFICLRAESVSIDNVRLLTRSHVKRVPFSNWHVIAILFFSRKVRAKFRASRPSLGGLEEWNKNVSFSCSYRFSN